MRRRVRHVHFVGIGGIGMSGLAELLLARGYRVSGSDLAAGVTVERLRGLGVEVREGHDAAAVGDADVLVYSSAVRADNPERREAERRGIPQVPRGEMLAELARGHEGVAIAGSHGKTTTTSLVAHVLTVAGLDPTAVIGGRVLGDGAPRGVRVGKGPWMVMETDESDGSFLHLAPVVAVITNIDPEHLDHYGSFSALEDAFVRFANSVPFWGLTVLCADHPGVREILPRVTRRTMRYGLGEDAELRAADLARDGFGTRFEVRLEGRALGPARVPLPGAHNVANALAAIAVARELELPFDATADALASFAGVERRFERKGEAAGVVVIDDYAHNPAKVRAALAAARAAHAGRVVAVFQPHRYTRTRDSFDDFVAAFDDADRLVVTGIYAAGEDPVPGVDAERLAGAIRARGHDGVEFVATLDELAARLPGTLEPGDLLLTLGAGDVSSLGPRVLQALEGGGKSR